MRKKGARPATTNGLTGYTGVSKTRRGARMMRSRSSRRMRTPRAPNFPLPGRRAPLLQLVFSGLQPRTGHGCLEPHPPNHRPLPPAHMDSRNMHRSGFVLDFFEDADCKRMLVFSDPKVGVVVRHMPPDSYKKNTKVQPLPRREICFLPASLASPGRVASC